MGGEYNLSGKNFFVQKKTPGGRLGGGGSRGGQGKGPRRQKFRWGCLKKKKKKDRGRGKKGGFAL